MQELMLTRIMIKAHPLTHMQALLTRTLTILRLIHRLIRLLQMNPRREDRFLPGVAGDVRDERGFDREEAFGAVGEEFVGEGLLFLHVEEVS